MRNYSMSCSCSYHRFQLQLTESKRRLYAGLNPSCGVSGVCDGENLLWKLGLTHFSLHRIMKFSIKDFFSKCDQIRRKLRIWSYLL